MTVQPIRPLPQRGVTCSTGSRLPLYGVALAAAALASPASVSGQTPDAAPPAVSTQPAGTMSRKAPYRVVVDQVAGTIQLQNQRGSVVERWDRLSGVTPLANVPSDRPVNVVIVNANPLLYDYGVRAEVIRQEAVTSCRSVGSRFLSEGFLLSSAAVLGISVPSFAPPQIPAGFLDINAALSSNLATRGAGRLTQSMLEQEMGRIRAEVNSFTGFATRFNTLAQTTRDSIALFASMGEGAPLAPILERYQQSLDALVVGLSDPAKTPLLVAQRVAEAAPAVTALRDLVTAIESGNYAGQPTDLAAREAVLLQSRVDAGVSIMQASYSALQRDLLVIQRVKAETTRSFTIRESGGTVRRLVVSATRNGKFTDVLRVHEGDVEIFTRPRAGLACDMSLGLSWLEPLPTYGFDGNGKVIDQNTSDRRVAPVLMLHIAPPNFSALGLGLGLGLGKHSAPDLYLGGTAMMFTPLTLNVGWAWQRTPQLPDGFTLGGVVATPDPLAFDRLRYRFQRTFFFGVGIRR